MSARQTLMLAAKQAGHVHSFTSTLHMQLSGTTSAAISGTMQYRASPLLTEMDLSASAAGQTLSFKEILSGSALYLSVPVLAKQLGKPWLELSFAKIQQQTGASLTQLLQQSATTDPLNQARMLSASKNARRAGTQVIDGVRTTEYTGSYPVSAGLSRLPASVRTQMQQVMATMGLRTIQFQIWLDGQQDTRRLIAHENGATMHVTLRMDIVAVNQPVTITIPPASQIATPPPGSGL